MAKKKQLHTTSSLFYSVLLVVILLIIFYGFLFAYTRAFLPHDEGWILNPAQRILTGDIPYRDFHYIYTPGLAYLMSGVFALFGISFLTARLFTMLFSLMSVFFIILISKSISKHPLAYALPVLYFAVWLPMHINFAWPVVYAAWAGLLSCVLFLFAQKKKQMRYLFFAGLAVGLTFIFKQNFGVAVILNSFIFFFGNRRFVTKRNLLLHILGIALLPVFIGIYLAINHAFLPFVHDMYFFMIEKVATSAFIYPDVWYRELLKLIFYLFPLLISVPACLVAWKYNKSLVFLASFCGLFYLFGIRPNTDLPHYVPLMALSGIPFLILVVYIKKFWTNLFLWVMMTSLFFLGIYSGLFRNHYRWDPPLIDQHYQTNVPRLGILTDVATQQALPQITHYIESQTKPNDYLFIYSFSPSYYVLTNRKNPTKFILLSLSLLSETDQREIIQNLKDKKVKLLLADCVFDPKASILGKYIATNYTASKTVGPYTFWKRNEKNPVP